jgi:quercetin dioxygenase-like cupin family protein
MIIGISGSAEITAGGETRVLGPGDVLLAEGLDGAGHSSRSTSGFTAVVVVLGGPPSGPPTGLP